MHGPGAWVCDIVSASDCVGYVARPCVGGSSDGLLVASDLYECFLVRSSTLWLLPFTLLRLLTHGPRTCRCSCISYGTKSALMHAHGRTAGSVELCSTHHTSGALCFLQLPCLVGLGSHLAQMNVNAFGQLSCTQHDRS